MGGDSPAPVAGEIGDRSGEALAEPAGWPAGETIRQQVIDGQFLLTEERRELLNAAVPVNLAVWRWEPGRDTQVEVASGLQLPNGSFWAAGTSTYLLVALTSETDAETRILREVRAAGLVPEGPTIVRRDSGLGVDAAQAVVELAAAYTAAGIELPHTFTPAGAGSPAGRDSSPAALKGLTPRLIRAAAFAFNTVRWNATEDGDLRSCVADGEPTVDVSVEHSGASSDVSVVATVGIVTPDGDFLAAETPRVLAQGRRLPARARGVEGFATSLVNRSYGKGHRLPIRIHTVIADDGEPPQEPRVVAPPGDDLTGTPGATPDGQENAAAAPATAGAAGGAVPAQPGPPVRFEPVVGTGSLAEREALSGALNHLAHACDFAKQRDNMGFSAADAHDGHLLAALPAEDWEPETTAHVWSLLRKYRRQLENAGIAFNDFPLPPLIAAEQEEERREQERDDLAIEEARRTRKELARAQAKEHAVARRRAEESYVLCAGAGQEVLVHFPFDWDMVAEAKRITGRKYREIHGDYRKVNIYPFTSLRPVLDFADRHGIPVGADVTVLADLADLRAVQEAAAPDVTVWDGRLAVRAERDDPVLDALYTYNGQRSTWSKQDRCHRPPIHYDPARLRDLLADHELTVAEDASALIDTEIARQAANRTAATALTGEPLTIPGLAAGESLLPAQYPAVRYALEHRRVFIGDTMGWGKEQPVSEPVLTPHGWTPIGRIRPGDFVIGRNGQPTRVSAVFPQGVKPVCRIRFNDGGETRAGLDHLWQVQTGRDLMRRTIRVMPTRDLLAQGLRDGAGNRKFRIPVVAPVAFPATALPLDPYLLGVLLGDGSIKTGVVLTTADDEILAEVAGRLPGGCVLKQTASQRPYDYRISAADGRHNPVTTALRGLGLFGHGSPSKFIPEAYLFAAVADRVAVLQGLLDTDGYIDPTSSKIEYATVSLRLAHDVTHLARSLGGIARTSVKTVAGKRPAYRLTFSLPAAIAPFRLARKARVYRPRIKYPPTRLIDSITLADAEESVCLRVESDDHLYVTSDFVVTHNTLSSLASVAAASGWPAVVVCRPSLTQNWAGEIGRFFPGLTVQIAEGTRPAPVRPGVDVVVIGTAALGTVRDVGGRKTFPWAETLTGWGPSSLILDEGQDAKTATANRTQAISLLAGPVAAGDGLLLDLSGTPLLGPRLGSVPPAAK